MCLDWVSDWTFCVNDALSLTLSVLVPFADCKQIAVKNGGMEASRSVKRVLRDPKRKYTIWDHRERFTAVSNATVIAVAAQHERLLT